MLGVWPDPSVVDRVDGVYRGAAPHDAALARAALALIIEPLLTQGSPAVKVAAAETVGRLKFEPALPSLFALLRQDRSVEVRMAALEGLSAADYDGIEEAVQVALADGERQVRMAALGLIPALPLPPERVAELLASVMDERSVEEQQAALEALGKIGSTPAQDVMAGLFDRLEGGALNPALQLDVMEAVAVGGGSALQARLDAYRATRTADHAVAPTGAALLAAYGETLEGGDAGRGRRLFYQHPAAQCVRCHVVGDWGGDVGPPLTDVAARLSREQLLEALVAPGARIAPGYGNVTLTLQDGSTVQGVLRQEADAYVVVQTADGSMRNVPNEEITDRQNAPSAMPPMGLVLQRRELRDVIAFLATLEGQ